MLAIPLGGALVVCLFATVAPVRAAGFSPQECRFVVDSFVTAFKSRDIQSFSPEFRQTFVGFIAPDRKTHDCTGPTDIVYKTDADRAMVAEIHKLAADRGVNLVAKGFPTYCTQVRTYTFQPKRFDITETDYLCTQLAALGLPYDLVKALAGENLSSTNIAHAMEDIRELNFLIDPSTGRLNRQMIKNLGILDRADPTGRAQRIAAYKAYDAWLTKNGDEIRRLQDAIARADMAAAQKKKAESDLRKLMQSAPKL